MDPRAKALELVALWKELRKTRILIRTLRRKATLAKKRAARLEAKAKAARAEAEEIRHQIARTKEQLQGLRRTAREGFTWSDVTMASNISGAGAGDNE